MAVMNCILSKHSQPAYYSSLLIVFQSVGGAVIAFVQPSHTVVEGSGSLDVCVQISGLPIGGLGFDITVNFNFPSGSASTYMCMYVCEIGREC